LFSWNLPLKIQGKKDGGLRKKFQSLFSWNLPLKSGFFSSFFLFLSVKPAFSHPPAGMNAIYQMPY
jgi:hypothetical protein